MKRLRSLAIERTMPRTSNPLPRHRCLPPCSGRTNHSQLHKPMHPQKLKAHMFTISLIGQKGGNGKTTVALDWRSPPLVPDTPLQSIDLDPQASAAKWSAVRADEILRSSRPGTPIEADRGNRKVRWCGFHIHRHRRTKMIPP